MYELDGTHMNPSYLTLLERELNNHCKEAGMNKEEKGKEKADEDTY